MKEAKLLQLAQRLGLKPRSDARTLDVIIAAPFDSRLGGTSNQKHIATIGTMLESNGGHLKDEVYVTEDGYQVTTRHGIEALQQYCAKMNINPNTVIVPVIVLSVRWEKITPAQELSLRQLAYAENADKNIKLGNEQADTNMLVRRMVALGKNDAYIHSQLDEDTPVPVVNKAIKVARQSDIQAKRSAYVDLREQGVAEVEAIKQSKIHPKTAAKAEETFQTPNGDEDDKQRLHKLDNTADTMLGQWGRAGDFAIQHKLTQDQRRRTYQRMEKILARLTRKAASVKTVIDDFIKDNSERIR